MFVYKNNPVEIDLFSHVKTFFCSKQFAKLLTTWLKTIYRSQVFGLPLKKSFYSILLELFIQFRTSFGERKSFVTTWRFRRSYHFRRKSNCRSVMQVKLCVQRQINANTQEFMFHFIRHHLSSCIIWASFDDLLFFNHFSETPKRAWRTESCDTC